MKRTKVIADDKIPFLKGILEPVADVSYLPGKQIKKRDLMDADALLIRTRTKCNADLLEGTAVKFIATATIGFDHIDAEYCEQNNIQWRNAPGCNSSSVEQYIVAALLHMSEKHSFCLKDKKLGIIGVGNVGSKVARAARVLGMEVLLNDPPRERVEKSVDFVGIDEIRANADIITFHVPLNMSGIDKTYHLADSDFYDKVAPGIIIMNSSRGGVINEKALKDALSTGRVKDAVIDVWENEPLIDEELLKRSGIATPHIAGYSVDGKANGTMMSTKALSDFFGLGLKSRMPEDLPGKETRNIVVDCTGMHDEEIIREVYSQSYEIMNDDSALRENVRKFEDLRGNYPVRREPAYYSVRLNNNPFEYLEEMLENLGFSVLEIDCFC